MHTIRIYAGEDFAVYGEVSFNGCDPATTLQDFDISVEISTSLLGRKIRGSTFPHSLKPLIVRDNGIFGINVNAKESSEMTPGDAVLSLAIIHKKTGAKIINEQKILTIIESKGKNHES